MQLDIAGNATRPLKHPAPATAWLRKLGNNLSNFFHRRKLDAITAPASARCHPGSAPASDIPPLRTRRAEPLPTAPPRSCIEQQVDTAARSLGLGPDVTPLLKSAFLSALAGADHPAQLSAELGDAMSNHLATQTSSQLDVLLRDLAWLVNTAHRHWPDAPQIIVLLDALARATLHNRNEVAITEGLNQALQLALDDDLEAAEARLTDVLNNTIKRLSGDPDVPSDEAKAAALQSIWSQLKGRPQCEYEALLLLCEPDIAGSLLAAAIQSDKTSSQENANALHPASAAARARLRNQKVGQLLYIEQTKTESGLAIASRVAAAVRAAAKGSRADVEEALLAAWNEANVSAAAHAISKDRQHITAQRALLGHIQKHALPAREVLRRLAPPAIREQMEQAIRKTDPPEWQAWRCAVSAPERLAAIPTYASWCEEHRADLVGNLNACVDALMAGLKESPTCIDSAALHALASMFDEDFSLLDTSEHSDDIGIVERTFDIALIDLFKKMDHKSLLTLAKRLPKVVMKAKAGALPLHPEVASLLDKTEQAAIARARNDSVSVLRKLAHEHMAGQRQPAGISAALQAVYEKIQAWRQQPENHYQIVALELSHLPSSEYQAYLNGCDAATLSELAKVCAEGNPLKRAINIRRHNLLKQHNK